MAELPPTTYSIPDSILMPAVDPGKKRGKFPKKFVIIGLNLFAGIACILIAYVYIKRTQDTRNQATGPGGSDCSQSTRCVKIDAPGNSGSFQAAAAIESFVIKAGTRYFSYPGADGSCYQVTLESASVRWTKNGDGPDCQDVSHVQIWSAAGTPALPSSSPVPTVTLPAETPTPTNSPNPLNTITPAASTSATPATAGFGTPTRTGTPSPIRTLTPTRTGTPSPTWTLTPTRTPTPLPTVTPGGPSITPSRTPTISRTPTLGATPTFSIAALSGTPSSTGIIARCNGVVLYDTAWNIVPAASLASIRPGQTLRLSASATVTSGTVDRIRFVVNTVTLPETIRKKPGTDIFYYDYVIPSQIGEFRVRAQMHHSVLGWF